MAALCRTAETPTEQEERGWGDTRASQLTQLGPVGVKTKLPMLLIGLSIYNTPRAKAQVCV